MISVGVKELKNHLSEYLRKVRQGERVVVTDRGRPVVAISRVEEEVEADSAWKLVAQGLASWSGGKPAGSPQPPRARQGTVAEAVLEDRR